jgi:hypothetical protein
MSFLLGLSDAVMNSKFKTLMHVRCTNERMSRETLRDIVKKLSRYEFLFTIHKVTFFLLCVASLFTIIYCYVSICRIVNRKSIFKLNSTSLAKINTNNSIANKLFNVQTSSEVDIQYDHQVSLTKSSATCEETQSITRFELGDTENLDKKIDLNEQINQDVLPFIGNSDVRWSFDLNEPPALSNCGMAGGILKKPSLKRQKNRKNSSFSLSNMVPFSQTESMNEGEFNGCSKSLKFNEPVKIKSYSNETENTPPFRNKLYSIYSYVSSKKGSTNSISHHNSATNNSSSDTMNNTNIGRHSSSIISYKNHSALKKTFIIILVFFIFWLPFLVVQWIILIHDNRSHLIEHFNLLAIAVGFCHSSISPFVYCCTNIEIFKAIKAQFSCLFAKKIIKS